MFKFKRFGLILIFVLVLVFILWFFRGYNPFQQVFCMMRNDKYEDISRPLGEPGYYHCTHTYSDGGERCRNSDECEGRCLISEETQTILDPNRLGKIGGKIVIGGYGRCELSNKPTSCFPGTIEDPFAFCF